MGMKNMAFALAASLLLPVACFAIDDFEVEEGNYMGTPTRSVTLKYNGPEIYEGICGIDNEKRGTMSLVHEPHSNLLII